MIVFILLIIIIILVIMEKITTSKEYIYRNNPDLVKRNKWLSDETDRINKEYREGMKKAGYPVADDYEYYPNFRKDSQTLSEQIQSVNPTIPTVTICDELFQYTGNSNGYLIEKYIGFDDEKIIIPSTFNNITIISLNNNLFKDCKFLKTVQIEAHIETLPDSIFSGCINLESIVLPKTLKHIGCYTFANCQSLTSINIPETVISIGRGSEIIGDTFSCSGLIEVTLPQNLKTLCVNIFYGCKNLKSVHLPYFLEEINDGSFTSCKNLKEVVIPRSVIKIGKHVFDESYICQPDRRYNPFVAYKKLEIVIFCYAGSYAQTFFRPNFKLVDAETLTLNLE